MTYKEKFVAVIKRKGKIMREYGGTVRIPFGSEYTIYMKNLSTCKAVVNVSVDGDDTLDGNQLVLPAKTTLNLRGFMKGSSVKNRFRFIHKTKEIADHRGDRIDDGIVRVEFQFEKDEVMWGDSLLYDCTKATHDYTTDTYKGGQIGGTGDWTPNTIYTVSNNCSFSNSAPKVDEGITVKGSRTNQQFNYTTVGALTSPEVIVLRLKGRTSRGRKVKRPITTRTKIVCPTCGRRWKSSMKYCGNCSTYIG